MVRVSSVFRKSVCSVSYSASLSVSDRNTEFTITRSPPRASASPSKPPSMPSNDVPYGRAKEGWGTLG